MVQTVLDYAYEGIVSIDQERRVVTFNPEAERITRIDGKRAMGQNIQETLPQLKLERLLTTGKDELGQVIDIGKIQILCNKVPIRVQGTTIGAVATFQDTGKIQQWEANIRKKIYAEEHIAIVGCDSAGQPWRFSSGIPGPATSGNRTEGADTAFPLEAARIWLDNPADSC